MKKTLLLFILVFLICGFNYTAAGASGLDADAEQEYNFKLTEREAAKIAFCDYIKQNGEPMIPELGLRVVSVVEDGDNYIVTLAIYEKLTNKIVNECATYTLNSRSGRIVSVKKLRASSNEICADTLASEILAGNYANADALVAKANAADGAACKTMLENAKRAATAKAMNGEGSLESIAEYFDNRPF